MAARQFRLYVAIVLTSLLVGCAGPTFSVLTDLPNPPRELAGSTTPPPPATNNTIRPAPPSGDIPPDWVPAVRPIRWRYVVIHHSSGEGGSAEAFDRYHRSKGWDSLGYHFVITNGHGGTNGAVQVGSRWTQQKWGAHTGGTPNNEYNNFGIGICLVGDFNDHMPTQEQLAAMDRLVRYLMREYGIAPANVIGHRDAPSAKTDCPGVMLYQHVTGPFRRQLSK